MSSKKAAKKAKQRQKKEAEQGRILFDAAGRGDCGAMGHLLDGGVDVNALAETGNKHPRTGQPIHPRLLQSGYDSDDEVDEGWRLRRAEVLLDEFEDVTPPEKAFMKLWNRWIFARPIQADRDVPRAVVAFARAHAAEIAGQNLRHNFLLHLFHLWDNSLLAAAHISAALDVVDDEAARPTSEEP